VTRALDSFHVRDRLASPSEPNLNLCLSVIEDHRRPSPLPLPFNRSRCRR
jgi:hypothetical protein